jgi:hypothetical protein
MTYQYNHSIVLHIGSIVDGFRTLNWQKIKREVEESGIFDMSISQKFN